MSELLSICCNSTPANKTLTPYHIVHIVVANAPEIFGGFALFAGKTWSGTSAALLTQLVGLSGFEHPFATVSSNNSRKSPLKLNVANEISNDIVSVYLVSQVVQYIATVTDKVRYKYFIVLLTNCTTRPSFQSWSCTFTSEALVITVSYMNIFIPAYQTRILIYMYNLLL